MPVIPILRTFLPAAAAIASVALGLAGLGCGTTLGPVFADSPVPAGEARITIYRPRAFSASRTDATIGVEQCGRPAGVAKLANGSFFRYTAVPGQVIVMGGVFGLSDREAIELAPGQEIFFRVKLVGFVLRAQRTEVPRAEALTEIAPLREAPVESAMSSQDSC